MNRIEGYHIEDMDAGATFASYAADIGTWFFGIVKGVSDHQIIAYMPNSRGGHDTIAFDRTTGCSDHSGQIRYVGLLPEAPEEWEAPVAFMAQEVNGGRAVILRDLPEPSLGMDMNY